MPPAKLLLEPTGDPLHGGFPAAPRLGKPVADAALGQRLPLPLGLHETGHLRLSSRLPIRSQSHRKLSPLGENSQSLPYCGGQVPSTRSAGVERFNRTFGFDSG